MRKHLVNKLLSGFKFNFNYLIVHRGNKASYLRAAGARIGSNCDLQTALRNFGSEPYLLEIGNDVTLTAGVMLIEPNKTPGSCRRM